MVPTMNACACSTGAPVVPSTTLTRSDPCCAPAVPAMPADAPNNAARITRGPNVRTLMWPPAGAPWIRRGSTAGPVGDVGRGDRSHRAYDWTRRQVQSVPVKRRLAPRSSSGKNRESVMNSGRTARRARDRTIGEFARLSREPTRTSLGDPSGGDARQLLELRDIDATQESRGKQAFQPADKSGFAVGRPDRHA